MRWLKIRVTRLPSLFLSILAGALAGGSVSWIMSILAGEAKIWWVIDLISSILIGASGVSIAWMAWNIDFINKMAEWQSEKTKESYEECYQDFVNRLGTKVLFYFLLSLILFAFGCSLLLLFRKFNWECGQR